MFSIEGLEKLERELKIIGDIVASLEGDIGQLQFDPGDSDSVRAATEQMERLVDDKLSPFRNHEFAVDLAKSLKAEFRDGIVMLGRRGKI